MAKKGRTGAAEPSASTPVPSREALQRISYLRQAAVLLRAVVPPTVSEVEFSKDDCHATRRREGASDMETERTRDGSGDGDPAFAEAAATPKTRKRRRMATNEALQPVSSMLAGQMSAVGKKATVRIDPTLKRTVCKSCQAALVPGLTATVRVKPSKAHAHMLVYTCSTCLVERRIPATPHSEPPPPPPLDGAEASAEPAAAPRVAKTKRERREARQARPPVFFERPGHVVVRGKEVVSRDEYRG